MKMGPWKVVMALWMLGAAAGLDTDRNGSTDLIFAYGSAGDWGVSGNIGEARP